MMTGALAKYALAGGALVTAVAGMLTLLIVPERAAAVWYAAGIAYAVQLVAFGALLKMRERARGFYIAWGGGTLVRFGVIIGAGVWLLVSAATAPAAWLLSLAGFLFLLLILEPVFFRMGLESE